MILRRYQTLGSLPEWIVGIALLGMVGIITAMLIKVSIRPPVIIVPGATGSSLVSIARPNRDYAIALGRHFLGNWYIWSPYTYQFRRSAAISLMAPEAQGGFRAAAQDAATLVTSMSQSQSIQIDSIDAAPMEGGDGNVWLVNFTGRLQTHYGGVGGAPDPIVGQLLLTRITPSASNAMLMEVRGFKPQISTSGTNLGSILRIDDLPAPAPTPAPSTPELEPSQQPDKKP